MATVGNSKSSYRGMACKSGTSSRPGLPECSNHKSINEKKVAAYFDALLRRFVEDQLSPFFDETENANPSPARQRDALAGDINRIENQIRVLIREQAAAVEEVQPFYRSEVEGLTQQVRRMKQAQVELQQKSDAVLRVTATQEAAREDLIRLSVDGFWQQDSRTINQMLHRLMGQRKLVVQDAQIVGYRERAYRNRRPEFMSRV